MNLRPALPLLAALLSAACDSASPGPPAGAAGQLSVRVPAGLRLARSLDTLTVSLDPAALAPTTLTVTPGLFLGVETEARVFPLGGARPLRARRALAPGPSFEGRAEVYVSKTDGLPVPGTRYVAEVTFVLFETDVAPGPEWDPHSGRFKPLWTRALRQAEE